MKYMLLRYANESEVPSALIYNIDLTRCSAFRMINMSK